MNTSSSEQWKRLLSARRLGKESAEAVEPGRSPFQQDFDRIVFSSAFRSLQDKTQVFPLADNAYVRTRLTHSIECASIGRSLGTGAGVAICRNRSLGGIQPSDVGAIVAAACLGHDIGNPPFGHSGEEAIRYWFTHSTLARELQQQMTPRECADFEFYEGNAQGFRVLSRLQMPDNYGGMQLTCATLAASAKYPGGSQRKYFHKFNFFQDDRDLFREVADETGMLLQEEFCWKRHPLAFLVEAADDITYRIIDFEDGHMLRIIPYEEVEERFLSVLGEEAPLLKSQLEKIADPDRRVELLRARTLGVLIRQIIQQFSEHLDEIAAGEWTTPLVEQIPAAGEMQKIIARSAEDIYTYRRAAEIEAAGYELTFGLLDTFVPAIEEVARERASDRSRKLLLLLPKNFWPLHSEKWRSSCYVRLLTLLDYVAGMTDSAAVTLFKKIKGISLPGI